MNRDSAIVAFTLTGCFILLGWKALSAVANVPVVTPVEEKTSETPPQVIVDGPGMIVPAQAMASPYVFLPPSIPFLYNRGSMVS